MMFYKEISWLHNNLPFPLLKLWGSSEKIVSLSRKLAFGGEEYIRWCKLLHNMEKWPYGKIYEFQFERLKKTLEHAYKNVPYYKEMFDREHLKPFDIKCLEDLQKLPIITKDDVLGSYNKFFASNLKYRRKVYRRTSGTSGRSVKFYLDENTIAAVWGGHLYFRSLLGGYTLGRDVVLRAPLVNPVVYLLPNGHPSFGFYSPVTKQVIFPTIGNATFKKYIEFIKKFNIKHVEGFPSYFFAFAKYLRNKNERIKIKTAFLSSEVLYEFQKKFIEKYMGCEVFTFFGSAEQTIQACECDKHEGKHISPMGLVEVKDKGLEGKGELVMTNLMNYTFPLIRYTTKDIITLSPKKCRCGRPFPRLMSVEGRENDFVMLPDGEYLHSGPFAWSTVLIPNIKDIFFFQHEDYSLDVFVVKEEKGNADKIMAGIKKRVKELSKDKLKVRVIFKDCIERKSNKFRFVETKVASYREQFSINSISKK